MKSQPIKLTYITQLFWLTVASLLLCSCASQPPLQPPVITSEGTHNTGIPKISGLTDIGVLALAVGDPIPTDRSDSKYTPGEWVIVNGKNISTSEVLLNDVPIQVSRYYLGKPIIQLPTGLSPANKTTLTVKTEYGQASYAFQSTHYIVASDTDGKQFHIVKTDPTQKGGISEEWGTISHDDMQRPLFGLISQDSRYFFAINIKDRGDQLYSDYVAYEIEIFTFLLGAPETPELLSRKTFTLGSSPIDAKLNDNGELVVLGKNSFMVLDVRNPLNISFIGRKLLPTYGERTTYVDVEFFDHNTKLAFLETHSNRLVAINNNATDKFQVIDELAILSSKSIPLSIDIEVDKADDSTLWVLQGQNYRLASHALKKIYNRIRKGDVPSDQKAINQLSQFAINNDKLTLSKTIALPDGHAAYFSKFGVDGKLKITLTKLDFIESQYDIELNKQLFKSVGSLVWNTVKFGKIISVDTDTGNIETVSSGVGIYYDIVDIPDLGHAFTLMKFGPSFSYPGLTPNWGIGLSTTGTYTKRKMDKYAIFPPYSVGFIVYQE